MIESLILYRGVAGEVHTEDQEHAEVGEDVPADVEDAGVIPVEDPGDHVAGEESQQNQDQRHSVNEIHS